MVKSPLTRYRLRWPWFVNVFWRKNKRVPVRPNADEPLLPHEQHAKCTKVNAMFPLHLSDDRRKILVLTLGAGNFQRTVVRQDQLPSHPFSTSSATTLSGWTSPSLKAQNTGSMICVPMLPIDPFP